MTEHRRLSLSDLTVGEPLAWDVYGAGNKLLLRRGYVLESLRQAEELVDRGLFTDGAQMDQSKARPDTPSSRVETPSALRFINMASKRLERLLYNVGNETEVPTKFLEVTKALTFAVNINPDIALASIQLNRAYATYAVRHCVDTALLAFLVARAMQKEPVECQSIMAAALTMNIAMLRQHDQLQNKEEPLSEAESALIREHAHRSAEILFEAGVRDQVWLGCVRMHHADLAGSGDALGPEAGPIPDAAKIVAFADRYCAAVSPRMYRKTLLPAVALRDVLMPGGKAGEPVLAAYFIKELGANPPGALVRLQCGEIGVVTQRCGPSSVPAVHACIGPRGAPLGFPIKRDTAKPLYEIREALPHDHIKLCFSMHQLWGNEAAT